MNYDLSQILAAFYSKGLVKFKRDYVVTSLVGSLDNDLFGSSSSGKYFNQGVNPLITLKNIEALMPSSSDMTVSAWSNAVTYGIDECASATSVYYRSKVLGNLNHAVSDAAYWTVTSLMSIWIRQKLNGVIEAVLSKCFLADKLIDHQKAYIITNNDDTIVNSGNYVGYEIRPTNSDNLKIVLNRIGTQFSANQTNLNLYLYKNNTLVTTIALSSLVAGEFNFTDITDAELSGEGKWYLFYNQDNLTGVAYNWPVNFSSSYTDIYPFEVANTTTDFVNDVSAYTVNSYGLGLDYSIYADLTQFILTNISMFAEVIQLQWQYDILELFLLNPEVKLNLNQRNIDRNETREILLGELKSETAYSLASRLSRAYKNLLKSLDFGDITLPGDDEQFITFNSFG